MPRAPLKQRFFNLGVIPQEGSLVSLLSPRPEVCEDIVELRGGNIRLGVNRNAGGAICRLWWREGKGKPWRQVVNAYDYGRQIQTAFQLDGRGEAANPTETGDKWGCPGVVPAAEAHGSRLTNLRIVGSELFTTCRPLYWEPEFHGGGRDVGVEWNGQIWKQVQLNYMGHPNRIKYSVGVVHPVAREAYGIEIVTAYLRNNYRNFWRWQYKRRKDSYALAQRFPGPNGGTRALMRGTDACIISTVDGSSALGAYIPWDRKYRLALLNFLFPDGLNGTHDNGTGKWSVLEHCRRLPGSRKCQPGITAGTHYYEIFMVAGSLKTVANEFLKMKREGW